MTRRVAILISGGGSNMEALVRSMTGDHPGRPVLVISNEPGAAGLARARRLNVPTIAIDHRSHGRDRAGFEAELARALDLAQADVICLAGFMRVLSPEFTARYAGRMLNIHPSLLPKYRGLHTHERVIAAGDAEHGCTVHEVTAELDGGPILGQARIPTITGESADDLARRLLPWEHRLYPEVLRRFCLGDRSPVLLG